jgi:hypothetical protein
VRATRCSWSVTRKWGRAASAACAALLLIATPAGASSGKYFVKVTLPPQWAHGQPGIIKVVGVAPPKAPYTSELVVYGTRLGCLRSGWAFLDRKDLSDQGYIVGAGVYSKYHVVSAKDTPPPADVHNICAYLMTVPSHATIARESIHWK